MNKILTAALMGYFMIIVFSVANVPDSHKKVDALTMATIPVPQKIKPSGVSLISPQEPDNSLTKALLARCSLRDYDHSRSVKVKYLKPRVKLALKGFDIRVTISDDPANKDREICGNGFAKNAPTILFITGKNDKQSFLETGRFCQAISLTLTSLGIGSCIIGWFDPEIAKTLLNLDNSEHLLQVMTLGFPAP